jgi:predicted small secreted protein
MLRRPTAALLAPALLIALLGLSACNTMEGLGQDMEQAGQEIEEEAQEHD